MNHIVSGRRGISAEVSASFKGSLLTIDLRFSDGNEQNKQFSSYLYSFEHPLQRGLNIKKGAANTFRKIYHQIYRNLFKDIWEENPTVDIGKELKGLHTFLVELQERFLSGLNHEYVKLCRKFPSSRMQYYRFLCDHDHPRVRQMFQSCPGLISAVVVGIEKSILKGRHVRYVARMIKNGSRIRTILEFLFNHLLHDSYVERCYFDLWKTVRNFCQPRWEGIKKDWFWLTERAGFSVSGKVVLMPPPAYLPKSQLPEGSRDRSNWYKRIRCFSVMMFPETEGQITLKQTKGFILMASTADKDFYKFFSRRKAGVVEYLMASRRVPGSKMCYRDFFREVRQYLLIRECFNCHPAEMKAITAEVKERNKVQDCTWSYQEDQLSLRPLVSWDDYQNESKLMSNCVRKLWYEAYRKNVIHFHVVYKETDYTLEMSLPSIFPNSLKGFKNSEPPKDLEEALIQVFLKQRPGIKVYLSGLGYEFPENSATGKSYVIRDAIEDLPF